MRDDDFDADADAAPPPPSVAIIGMAGRFPKAEDLDAFWANLVVGRDCITRLSAQESVEAGLDPRTVANPKYVSAKGVLENSLAFDAGLFGYSPREAEIIDPQQRVFLETAMAALEDAGCDPDRFDGSIGVFGGQQASSYVHALRMDPRNADLSPDQVQIGNDKDFLTSKVSYKLNLKGPSVVVQSACSTSLVALTLGYQSLLDYGCDVALAGGVCISYPDREGYVFEDGGTYSPDGYLRAFDSRPSGMLGGNGVGVVVLKRLEDAIADRDHIHAVVRGAAVNNDGSVKIGYTAPSVDGQAEAVSTALALGGIDPETIGYVEAHGTATRLGDPIEVAALTKAFRRRTDKTGYCGIGSVKTNIGHLDAAAGMAGLMKAVLAMQHGQIPPTLHVETLNPQIDFDTSPFYVAKTLTPWPAGETPRRASISSFGIGGTNAHVIIEEAPPAEPAEAASSDLSVLTLSANSVAALKRVSARLGDFLRAHPETDVADAAHTLQSGRKAWKHRLAVVCGSAGEAADLLDHGATPRVVRGQAQADAQVAFLFPGQGAQHVGMARHLYTTEASFKETVDRCADLLRPHLGRDIRDLIFAADSDAAAATELDQTRTTQPALFVVEYALAQLWISWGITPSGMLGHSIGEYVAACVAGVMDLPDALRLVARRGALMQSLASGAMASVPLPDHEVAPLIGDNLSLAAVLGPRLCVVSGSAGEVAAFEERLKGYGVAIRHIRTSHAFHSADMDPILGEFEKAFAGVTLRAPEIPFISNLTGTWITEADATDPAYWARQLRGMVRLREGLAELTARTGTICLEVGPGRGLSALAQGAEEGRRIEAFPSCRDRHEAIDDAVALMGAAGRLWTAGVVVDWPAVSGRDDRRKMTLPTYPFERQEYSLMHDGQPDMGPEGQGGAKRPVSDQLYAPIWRRSALPPAVVSDAALNWLVFVDGDGIGARCATRLEAMGHAVTTVALAGSTVVADHRVAAGDAPALSALVKTLAESGRSPDRILHLWTLGASDQATPLRERLKAMRVLGFDSLVALAKALGSRFEQKPCVVTAASSGLYDVVGEEVAPEKALLIGPCRVMPVEYTGVDCKIVDLASRDLAAHPEREIAALIAEASRPGSGDVAIRRGARWIRSFEALYFNPHGDPRPELPSRLRHGGTYLVTGGLGGIGLALARHLAERVEAHLVLTGRSLPEDHGEGIVEEITAKGGRALVVQADVTDRDAMMRAVAEANAHFGPIHGVIHAAGVAGRGVLQLKEAVDVDRVLAPKVEGTLILDEVLSGQPLELFVACSSISAVIGAPGQADYTSANAFQDAYAIAHRDAGARYLAIEWDRWAEVGMAVREMANQPGMADMPPWAVQGIAPADGAEAFEIAVDSTDPQIAVALDNFEWISRFGPPRGGPGPGQGQAPGPETARKSYERPEMETAFEAPTNDVERRIAELFHGVLGIKEIGIDDNFFDLGGHSLLGVKLVNGIQEAFAVEIGIGELFSLPTVRTLGRTVATRGGEPKRSESALAASQSAA